MPCSNVETKPTYKFQNSNSESPNQDHRQEQPKIPKHKTIRFELANMKDNFKIEELLLPIPWKRLNEANVFLPEQLDLHNQTVLEAFLEAPWPELKGQCPCKAYVEEKKLIFFHKSFEKLS